MKSNLFLLLEGFVIVSTAYVAILGASDESGIQIFRRVRLGRFGVSASAPPRGAATSLISCSPSPCVLPAVQVSEGGAEVTDTSIATSPLNHDHLLLGSVDFNCPPPSDLGFHLSTDGGTTWNVSCMEVIRGKNKVYWPTGSDPGVGYDRNGVAYVSGSYSDSEQGTTGFVGFKRSSDGVHWSQPAVALAGGPNSIPDLSWMTVDTHATSPYVNTVYISAPVFGTKKLQILVSHSSDQGKTWKVVAAGPPETGRADDEFTNMTVGKDGTVFLAWQHCLGSGPAADCGNGLAYMLFSKSSDGGNTWSHPAVIAKVALHNGACHCAFGDLPNSVVRISNFPVIGIDNSDGPYAGNLYAVMYSWTGSYMRVVVTRSVDGGKTWLKPVPLAPPNDTHDQFLPWLSVSPTGLVGVSWLDRRNDPSNVNYQAFAAISRDGGQSFQPNIQLTQSFSDPNNNGYPGWMGDNTGNTWAGSNFIAAWMDSSNGVDMQAMVGGIRLK